MQITLSASGLPAQINASIAEQCKAAANDNKAAWPTLVGVRNYVAKQLRSVRAGQSVTVTAHLSVAVLPVESANAPEPQSNVATPVTALINDLAAELNAQSQRGSVAPIAAAVREDDAST